MPNWRITLIVQGIHYAQNNNGDSAIHYFKKALIAKQGYPDAEANLKRALEMKKQVGNLSGKPSYLEAYNQGNALGREKNFKGAIEYYEKSIALNPSYPNAHNNAAIAYIQLGKTEDAIKHFSAALNIDSGFFAVYPNYAQVLARNGRHKEAIALLNKALKLQPDPALYHLQAEIYFAAGDKRAADKCLEMEAQILKSPN